MKKQISGDNNSNYPFFVTCTVINWLQIFIYPHYCQIILDALAYIAERSRGRLNAYVVMPSHFHAIIAPIGDFEISAIIRDLKRYTSRMITHEAERRGDGEFLSQFMHATKLSRLSKRTTYKVWRDGYYPEPIHSAQFAEQKLNYIHANPIVGKLVTEAVDWPYSSAKAYYLGEETYPSVDLLRL